MVDDPIRAGKAAPLDQPEQWTLRQHSHRLQAYKFSGVRWPH